MRLRTLFADMLSKAKLAKFPDHSRPKRQSHEQSRQIRQSHASRDVAEYAKSGNIIVKNLKQEPVEHCLCFHSGECSFDMSAARTFEQNCVTRLDEIPQEFPGTLRLLEKNRSAILKAGLLGLFDHKTA